MRIIITGTPGTGKTTIAHYLAKALKAASKNEKALAEQKKVGRIDRKTGERILPIKSLTRVAGQWLKQHSQGVLEGHVLCECKIRPVDWVIVLSLSPDRLEYRLRERGYSEVKIQDNVLCEGIDYCWKRAQKNYPKHCLLRVRNERELKEIISSIITRIAPKSHPPKKST